MYKPDTEDYSQIIKNPFYLKDPSLRELFQKCRPPKEAYFYFPKGEEIIIPHRKPEKNLRRIYHNVPYTDLENKWLSDFKNIINSHPENKIPNDWNDALNLTFIYSTECNLEKAYNNMIKYFKWLSNRFPMDIQPTDKVVELLNSGFVYIHGRDHQFRPIIICQPYIIQDKIDYYGTEVIAKAGLFICQFAVNNMFIPGQIENWIMFINLEGTSLLNIPNPIKKLISELSSKFLARLYKSYILGMSLLVRVLYKLVCNFLEEVTVKKVIIVDGKNDPRLFNDISPLNLEQRFGGRAPDLIYGQSNSLFPPRMPTNNFLKPNENQNQILISEQQYIDKCKRGDIPNFAISPFIQQKLDISNETKQSNDLENQMNLTKTSNFKLSDSFVMNQSSQPLILSQEIGKNSNMHTHNNNSFSMIGRSYDFNQTNNKKELCHSIQNNVNQLTCTNWELKHSEFDNLSPQRLKKYTNKSGSYMNDLYYFCQKKNRYFNHVFTINGN